MGRPGLARPGSPTIPFFSVTIPEGDFSASAYLREWIPTRFLSVNRGQIVALLRIILAVKADHSRIVFQRKYESWIHARARLLFPAALASLGQGSAWLVERPLPSR
jgi:hypothetical protein